MSRFQVHATTNNSRGEVEALRRSSRTSLALLSILSAAMLCALALFMLLQPGVAHADSRAPVCLTDSEIFPSVEPTITAQLKSYTSVQPLPMVSTGNSFGAIPLELGVDSRLGDTHANVCFKNVVHGAAIQGTVSGVAKNVTGGVMLITVNGQNFYGYCTDFHNPISGNQCFNAPIGISRPQVACVMFFYPAVSPLTPTAPATNAAQEGAARQAAVWHFSDNLIPTGPPAIANRAQTIINDINAKYASDQCPEIGLPALNISPIAGVNALTPNGSGGYLQTPHVYTVTLRMGGQLQSNRVVTSTIDFAQFAGGGRIATATTNATGQAVFTITSAITGVAHITATSVFSNVGNVRFDTSQTAQKLLVNWNKPFRVTGTATKEWIADGINVQKFHDYNMNGVQDPSEPPLNWVIRWRQLPSGAFTNVTLGIDGSTTIPVAPGQQYEICEVGSAATEWFATTPICVTGTVAGDSVKFGNTNLRALLVRKFNDLNGNGILDAGEPPLQNWGFGLFEWSGGVWKQRQTGVTASDGTKGFVDLNIAPHEVVESMQTGWYSSTATTQFFTFTSQILTGTLTFGNLQPASVTVNKSWSDGGASAPGRRISLCIERTGGATPARVIVPSANGTAMTNNTGTWNFCANNLTTPVNISNLWPGVWTIGEVNAAGWFVSGAPPLTLTSGEAETASLSNARPAVDIVAQPAIEQPYTWEIEKQVTPPALNLTVPGTGTFTYTVALTRTAGSLENPTVSGQVLVTNTTATALDMRLALVEVDAVDADDWDCDVVAALAAGATRACNFTASGVSVPPSIHHVDASVTFSSGGNTVIVTSTIPIDFSSAVPAPINGTVTVTDTQRSGSWSFTNTNTVTYTTTGNCEDIDFGDTTTGSKTITNTAVIVETGQESSVNVGVTCTLSQNLSGEKSVDWSGETPDTSQTFTICAQGPSFPTGTEPGACHTLGWEGASFTWGNVIPGDYTVTETDPGGSWTYTPSVVVEVNPGQDASVTVNNTYLPPTPTPTLTPTPTFTPTPTSSSTPTSSPTSTNSPTPTSSPTPTPETTLTPQPTPTSTDTPTSTPTLTPTFTPTFTPTPTSTSTATPTSTPSLTPLPPGSVVAQKVVDWGVQAAEISQRFTLCLTGNGITQSTPGACRQVGFNGGEIAWTGLLPGTYVVTEIGLDPSRWEVVGSGVDIVIVGADRVDVEIVNTNIVPTNDPGVGEPGRWIYRLPWIWQGD